MKRSSWKNVAKVRVESRRGKISAETPRVWAYLWHPIACNGIGAGNRYRRQRECGFLWIDGNYSSAYQAEKSKRKDRNDEANYNYRKCNSKMRVTTDSFRRGRWNGAWYSQWDLRTFLSSRESLHSLGDTIGERTRRHLEWIS